MTHGPRSAHLHRAGDDDPIWRLWEALPPQWRGPVLGEGISDWALITENDWTRLDLSGLPDPYAAELAWMAHWQACDGTRVSVLAMAQLAHIVRHAAREGRRLPPSIRRMDWEAAYELQGWYYTTYRRRLPGGQSHRRLRIVFGFAHQALIAACHDGSWWQLDDWHPLAPAV